MPKKQDAKAKGRIGYLRTGPDKGLELAVISCGFDKETFKREKDKFRMLVDTCFGAGEMWEQNKGDKAEDWKLAKRKLYTTNCEKDHPHLIRKVGDTAYCVLEHLHLYEKDDDSCSDCGQITFAEIQTSTGPQVIPVLEADMFVEKPPETLEEFEKWLMNVFVKKVDPERRGV